jgi:hypothetical protein
VVVHDGPVIDDQLSRGIVAFVGVPGRLGSKSAEERVVAAIGDTALDLLPRLKAIMEQLHGAEPPLWNHSSLAEVGRLAEVWLQAHYPQLSADAIEAVRNRFTFDWR